MTASDPTIPVGTTIPGINFLGGRLCLDFANSVDWHASANPVELLPTYDHFATWGRVAGLYDEETAARLRETAATRPDEAERVRVRAVALREAIYRFFSLRLKGHAFQQADLDLINAELGTALAHLRVEPASVPEERPFCWEWLGMDQALDAMLWPVARSAGDLLTSPEIERVRECDGVPCGWLFIDTSRNRSRRWCRMESCGNRAKARRHYERSRERDTTRDTNRSA